MLPSNCHIFALSPHFPRISLSFPLIPHANPSPNPTAVPLSTQMTNTFQLTELLPRAHTRIRSLAPSPSLSLPALKSLSPSAFSTHSTQHSGAREGLGCQGGTSQPVSPRNKARERLRRIDLQVKRYEITQTLRRPLPSPQAQAPPHRKAARTLPTRTARYRQHEDTSGQTTGKIR